jgi:glycosyltransferase involved in cell wall biosynthesis
MTPMSSRKHVLMITNHGIHQWRVIPGLPDTGGQNAFVNQFTAALAKLGFRVTIVNRGGYPHPVTGEWRKGVRYRGDHQRILYLEDGLPDFVRKEDMDERIPYLVESLKRFMDAETDKVDLIISHYWDGAKLGVLYNRTLPQPATHIWIPHSLGAIKKRNVSPQQWPDLRIDERISIERSLMTGGELDGIGATSSKIRQSLEEDYGCAGRILFLPPCVDPERFHPREVPDEDGIWPFLSQRCGLSPEEVRHSKIVTEISRTDATKRKDVLIKAFAAIQRRIPNSLLVVSIDENAGALAGDLEQLIRSLDLPDRVAVVGSISSLLPTVYAVTDVYCTPSVMEGFGMSAQEAAATAVPVVGSHLVPFVSEYLLGDGVEGHHPIRRGKGAVVVQADDVDGFAAALELLLADDDLRREMGANAYRITVPYFTWPHRVAAFLDQIGDSPGGDASPQGDDEETHESAD